MSEYENKLKKEIEILAELESDFIVQYKTSWIQKELINVNKRNKFSSSSSESETSEVLLNAVLYLLEFYTFENT